MASVKSFYEKRAQHRFLSDAVSQIENDDSDSVNVVVIGPPTGGHDSDMENEDEDVLKTTGLPDEVAGEIAVFNIRNGDIEGISDDGHDIVAPQPKKAKQTTKKAKVNVKGKKSHINSQTFSQYDQDKKAQAVLLENPELAALTMWTSFEKIFAPLIESILHETNHYAIRDKNQGTTLD